VSGLRQGSVERLRPTRWRPLPSSGNGVRPQAAGDSGERSNGAAARRYRPSFEFAVLAALLLLTAAFGRQFSKLEVGGLSWLHPTEVGLVALALAPLVRGGTHEWVRRLRASGVLVPLLVLWFFGAIATLRGLQDWGFSQVLHDIGLVEYSVLIPLVLLVVRDRRDFIWLCRVIALGGLLAVAVQAATYWTPLQWELAARLDLIAVASGMYACIYIAWIASRVASRAPMARWRYAGFVLAVAVTVIGVSRAAWLALLAVCAVAVAMAPAGRRLVTAGIVGALVVIGGVVAGPAARIQIGEPPALTAVTSTTEDTTGTSEEVADDAADRDASSGSETAQAPSSVPTQDPAPVAGGTQVASEIGASFDSSQAEGANARWRLDFWTFLMRQTAHSPLLGVGFGTPSSFVWSGIPYDSRTGNPLDPFDVSGPHNSFLNLLYRTGVLALLAVATLMVLAVMRLLSVSRRAGGEDRALAIWLLAALVATTIVAGLAVALEGPFMGIFFWTVLGLALIAPGFLGRRPPVPPRSQAAEHAHEPSANGGPAPSRTAA
jgi:hypothetical protein